MDEIWIGWAIATILWFGGMLFVTKMDAAQEDCKAKKMQKQIAELQEKVK